MDRPCSDVGRVLRQERGGFFRDTVEADVAGLRSRFLKHLQPGARILDAECGTGRDSKAFDEAGYEVVAFDGSAEMVRLARAHTGLPILHMTFHEMSWSDEFEGAWACASLLHLPRLELLSAFARFARALRPGAAWYVSTKRGAIEREADGRRFTDVMPDELAQLLEGAGFEMLDLWETEDARPHRQDRWVYSISRKPVPFS